MRNNIYLLKGLARSPSSSRVWERGLLCTTSKKPCLLPFSISIASPRLFSCDSLRPYVLNPPVKWARPRAVPTAMAPPNTFGNVLTTNTQSAFIHTTIIHILTGRSHDTTSSSTTEESVPSGLLLPQVGRDVLNQCESRSHSTYFAN